MDSQLVSVISFLLFFLKVLLRLHASISNFCINNILNCFLTLFLWSSETFSFSPVFPHYITFVMLAFDPFSSQYIFPRLKKLLHHSVIRVNFCASYKSTEFKTCNLYVTHSLLIGQLKTYSSFLRESYTPVSFSPLVLFIPKQFYLV